MKLRRRIRFEVADLYDLRYRDNAFDYLLMTNIAHSYLIPKRRRIRFLRQAHSLLKPGGLFILSFAKAKDGSGTGLLQWLLAAAARYAPFNKEYEPGDLILGAFVHRFQPEALKQEFEEARFLIREWLWDEGYAVLAKA